MTSPQFRPTWLIKNPEDTKSRIHFRKRLFFRPRNTINDSGTDSLLSCYEKQKWDKKRIFRFFLTTVDLVPEFSVIDPSSKFVAQFFRRLLFYEGSQHHPARLRLCQIRQKLTKEVFVEFFWARKFRNPPVISKAILTEQIGEDRWNEEYNINFHSENQDFYCKIL